MRGYEPWQRRFRVELQNEIMKPRGFPLPQNAECPYENFILHGVTVVAEDSHG